MDSSLQIIYQKARNTTLSVTKNVSDEDALLKPNNEKNTIVWHAGHIFVLVERCIFAAVEGADEMPKTISDNWWQLFGWCSDPSAFESKDFPPLSDVRRKLLAQKDELDEKITNFTNEFLDSPIQWSDPRWNGKPKRLVIIHGFYDELLHAGQIKQLLRFMATCS